MSEKEKEVTKEVMSNLNAVPKDGESFVRGYLKGMLDGIDVVKERKMALDMLEAAKEQEEQK